MEDERPPSSRPRTSGGRPGTAKRPKTAGRNSERPPTRSNAGIERPVSRKAVLERDHVYDGPNGSYEEPPPERIASRAGPPVSSYGNRPIASRMGTASGARPMTGSRMLPPGTGLARPVTQQGLAGVRAPSRAGTAFGSRLVMDKTYFMALLNTQLTTLNEEIESLEKEMVKFEQEQQKLLLYEQKAEEQAEEIRKLQGELTDYNLLIDRQNTNSDLSDLQYEVQEEQAKNEELSKMVEDMFRERREKEDNARILEQQVEEIKMANEDLMNSMDPGIREEYDQVKELAEQVQTELEMKQRELNELIKKKEEVDVALANSPLKQQAMGLHEQIAELELKKTELLDQLNAEGTPEQLREKLIEQIKKDNEEISNMQVDITELEEKISQSREELLEFENEYEIMAGEKNEKYRELKIKEIQIDEFVKDFDQKKNSVEEKMEESNLEIVKYLQLISLNCSTVNGLDTINATSIDESSLNMSTNPVELQELHVRLQEELIDLDEAKNRLEAELESMYHRQEEIKVELVQFQNIDLFRNNVMKNQSELVKEKENLESRLPSLEREVLQLQDELNRINSTMSSNPDFQKINSQRKILAEMEQEQADLKSKVEVRNAEMNYDELKKQALKLRQEYNATLVKIFGTR